MLSKTKMALAATLILGTLGAASVAQAHGDGAKWYPQDDDPGPPIATIHTMPSWHSSGGNAYDFVPSANHVHHNSKERIRGR
jgi:hypothetical protein